MASVKNAVFYTTVCQWENKYKTFVIFFLSQTQDNYFFKPGRRLTDLTDNQAI